MDIYDEHLKRINDVPQTTDFKFSDHTTYGCGGRAEIAYFPKNFVQAKLVYDYLKFIGKEFVILGNGSNVLASDKAYKGSVIVTQNLKGIYKTKNNSLFCFSGTKVSALIKYCIAFGYEGLEYLSGIPATIGGILYMNGGAGGKYISQNVKKVICYDGKICVYTNEECNFGYKYSTMRNINSLIIGAELLVDPSKSSKVKEKSEEFLKRREHQPKGKSCGCVFKNYNGISAGKIIQDASLAGLNVGGAYVSKEHANFIINGGASATDLYALICEVKRRVYEKFSILLEEEVIYIGEFNETDG